MHPTLSPVPLTGPVLAHIRRIAWCVRGLTFLAALVVMALPWVFWLDNNVLLAALSNIPPSKSVVLTANLRAVAALASLPLVATALSGLWQLWRLFDGYAQGDVFSESAATHLRRLGLIAMLMCVMKPLTAAMLSVVLTWHNPPGQRALVLSLSSDDYVMLLFGAVLLAIASVMQEAARLARESAEFV